jgi:hypothetical protein
MSQFSKILRRASIYVPTVIGEEYGGGYFAGYMRADGQRYALVVAKKAEGEYPASVRLLATGVGSAGASVWNGRANTEEMYALTSSSLPSAIKFCYELTAGGYSDWALPAWQQADLLYRAFKPGTTANYTQADSANTYADPSASAYTSSSPSLTPLVNFKAGGSEGFLIDTDYWTSTVVGTLTRRLFTTGAIVAGGVPADTHYARAVRMVKIPG